MPTDSESNAGLSSLVEQPSSQHSSQFIHPAASPFHKLATETIEQIFLEACPTIILPAQEPGTLGKNYSFRWVVDPLILLVVCRRWYMIMKAYRLLWSTIEISGWGSQPIGETEWDQWGIIQLRDRLDRSGAHPLRIRICGNRDGRLAVSGILDAIMPHSERWKSVDFAFRLGYEFLNSLMGRRFPCLKSIDFRPSTGGVTQAEISHANLGGMLIGTPSLTLIRFGRLPVNLLRNIPWRQLSEVVFDGSYFQYKADFRELCKYLSVSVTTLSFLSIKFTCEQMFEGFEPDDKPITLPKLRRLCIDSNLEGLLNVLICPSLEWLHIGLADGNELLYFLDANSSCALKHIHLYDIQPGFDGPSEYHYHLVLQAPPSSTLRSISLRELTDPVLDLLVYDSDKRFPFLETLRLDLRFERRQTEGNQYLTSRIEGLQKIMESRTQDTSLNHESLTPIHSLQFRRDRNDGESSLKNCFVEIRLGPVSEPKLDNYWDLKPLEVLHRLCLSRGVRSEQVIFSGLKRIV